MFEWWYLSSAASVFQRQPREIIAGVICAYAVIDIYSRYDKRKQLEIKTNAEVQIKAHEAEIERLKLEQLKYGNTVTN